MTMLASTNTRVLASIVLLGLAALGDAKKFLQIEPLQKDDVDQSLAAELAGSVSQARLGELEAALKPVYTALPKSEGGHLNHQAVRYVLHRFFVQRHGWYIRGFEPNGDSGANLPTKPALKDWIPAYLQSRLEERLGNRGVDLHELAVLAATLEDLVRREASVELKEIYDVMKLPVMGKIGREQAEDAIKTYMMVYLMNRNVTMSTPEDAANRRKRFAAKYKGWKEADTWLKSVESHHSELAGQDEVDFDSMVGVVSDIGEQFGSFNDGECRDLKSTLMKMEGGSGKVGRIRLADFYNMTLYTHWKFNEKREYLRELGALDESDMKRPTLILPNYISSFSNCLKATSMYAVCCRNECEDLMGHLEREIASPTARPDRILELVASMPSATVAAPRKLPQKLQTRLFQLGEATAGGEVNLHGRLFAQWMHHAFPRECPYPHETGTTNPQTADEWMQKSGTDAHASEEDMRKYVDACSADGAPQAGSEEEDLPWSNAEELLVASTRKPASSGIRRFFAMTALLLAALGCVAADQKLLLASEQHKRLRLMAGLIFLVVLGSAADLLDPCAFALPMIFGVMLLSGLRHVMRPEQACLPKSEKCSV